MSVVADNSITWIVMSGGDPLQTMEVIKSSEGLKKNLKKNKKIKKGHIMANEKCISKCK